MSSIILFVCLFVCLFVFFSFWKASTTRLMHYNDIPRYPILLQASKIVPWPLVSASRELGAIPGSLDSRTGHPPVWRANSRSRTTRVACAIKCHFFRFSFSSSHYFLIDIKCQVLSYFLSNISNADTVLINGYLTSRSERAIYNTMMPS